jgi:DNA-directed RNA polymerase subunit K/omega
MEENRYLLTMITAKRAKQLLAGGQAFNQKQT